jgi:hypothetical protein
MDNDVQVGPALGAVMRSPLWSSQFRLQTGFLPIDPRDSVGVCAALGVVEDPSGSLTKKFCNTRGVDFGFDT